MRTGHMNREEILSIKYTTPLGYHEEYYKVKDEKMQREIGYSLFKKIDDGNCYSVRITKTQENRDVEIKQIDAHIHQVQIMNMTYKPQPHLNWKERLKVLFTGRFPVGIGWE